MAKFDITTLFGVDVNFAFFNVLELVDALGIKADILNSKRVSSLIKVHGNKHHIVTIAIRQVTLAELKPHLNGQFLAYDPYFQAESLHSSQRERLYEAEEKLLLICWSLAIGKSVKSLKRLRRDFNTREWRDMYQSGKSLYLLFRQILNDSTREYVLDYKSGNVDEDGRSTQGSSATVTADPSHTKAVQAPKDAKKERLYSFEPTPFRKELQTALDLVAQGAKLMTEEVVLLQQGRPLRLDKLTEFCRKLIASHQRNPYPLLVLRHVRSDDDYLAEHTLACAVLACHLAKKLDLGDRYIEVITLGALLFDCGRFKIPAPILKKEGKLTDGEFDLMRKHIYFGESLLKGQESIPKVVYQMLQDHHERVDGAGYPNGKAGDEISIYGRIGAIVDAYDSMTSAQPFKSPITPAGALRKMQKEAGLAFDKELFRLFAQSLGPVPVGSCVELSNGRLAFVLTLNKSLRPALVRQVYSLSTKTFVSAVDVALDQNQDISIVKVVLPADYDLRFVDHIG